MKSVMDDNFCLYQINKKYGTINMTKEIKRGLDHEVYIDPTDSETY